MTPFLSHATALPSRRSTLGQMVEQSTVLLMVCIGSLIFVLAIIILFHQNANATKGYNLRSLEHQRSALLLEEEVVNMQVAQQQAIDTLQNDPRIVEMPIAKVGGYIQPDQTVAMQPIN